MASREHRNGPRRFTEMTRSKSAAFDFVAGARLLNARVVHQYVEPAELLDGRGEHLLYLVFIRDIRLHDQSPGRSHSSGPPWPWLVWPRPVPLRYGS